MSAGPTKYMLHFFWPMGHPAAAAAQHKAVTDIDVKLPRRIASYLESVAASHGLTALGSFETFDDSSMATRSKRYHEQCDSYVELIPHSKVMATV